MKNIPHVKPLIGWREFFAVAKYMRSGGYLTEYKQTEKFEEMLAGFLGGGYVSLVPNGTSALYLSLLAAGIGKGDKVIVPDLTMIASANVVRMVGAEPVLVDVELGSYCLDLGKVKITKRVKAMIYVDLNGRGGNMEQVTSFCQDNNLVLIEDAAQALGSRYKGTLLGNFGRFGCFSLGFHKIITTGQGGFILTHNNRDYEKIEGLKDFGRLEGGHDYHETLGFNFKFTDLQAVIGIEQLKTINWRMKKKRQLYEWYHGEPAPEGYVPWFIEWEQDNPITVYRHLANNNIATRLFYPPIHTQPIYSGHGYPNASRISKRILWLPSSLDLEKKDIDRIVEIGKVVRINHEDI